MKIIQFVFFLLVVGIISSCTPSNSTPNPPEHYAFAKINCYLRYMAQNRELQAEMTFRTDSTIAIKGDVLFNEEAMTFKKLPMVGFQYRLIKNSVSLEDNNTFSYTEKDGRTIKMDIKLNKFLNPRIVSDGLSKQKGGLLQWEGEALGKEDGLILIFTDSKGATFSINHSGISKGNEFEIIGTHLAKLSLGPATLLITRKKTLLNREDDITKMMSIEHYLLAIEFEVKE